MISGVAFLCIHAQIKNTVVPQISIGLMVRPKMMCGKQQHVPSSTENSNDRNSVACCTISLYFGRTGKHAVLFPGCHWCESWTRAEKKLLPSFVFVWHPSFADRAQKQAMRCDLLAVCFAEERVTVCTPTETIASQKATQSRRSTEGRSWAFKGLLAERANLALSCHAHCVGSFTAAQCVTPTFHNGLQNIQGSKGPVLLKPGFI